MRGADHRFGDGADRVIAGLGGRCDDQAGHVGGRERGFELLQEVAQQNAARNQFGRRGQSDPAGFPVGDDRYSLP
jgi:hypothetical protein